VVGGGVGRHGSGKVLRSGPGITLAGVLEPVFALISNRVLPPQHATRNTAQHIQNRDVVGVGVMSGVVYVCESVGVSTGTELSSPWLHLRHDMHRKYTVNPIPEPELYTLHPYPLNPNARLSEILVLGYTLTTLQLAVL
jgi:hypothetical protein